MYSILLKKLKEWRDETARKEGVENYRVIPNGAIEEIARLLPGNREELTNIKGIKDKKFYKYGRDIFDIIKSAQSDAGNGDKSAALMFPENVISRKTNEENNPQYPDRIFSVASYLDFLNEKLFLSGRARIKGEITSIDIRERVVYFSLKDPTDESVINCLIFKYNFDISGIILEVGAEVIITAVPEIYKPTGRLSLKAVLIEISGEGQLKRSYDELKIKLEKEGIFSAERKKPMPKLPKTIGLITSNQGAAIGDFMTNIGNYGFRIKFINSSVEGKQAIFDLINAVRTVKKLTDIDVLAIVRGGGSLESLQAFNNEALVRELTTLSMPVVCGVGHERDVSLVSLASDVSVSTPTAAAFAIRESWDRAIREIEYSKNTILNLFGKVLFESKFNFENNINFGIRNALNFVVARFDRIIGNFRYCEQNLASEIRSQKERVELAKTGIFSKYADALHMTNEMLRSANSSILSNDPDRQLRLGYSISYSNGKILRSIYDVSTGSIISTRLADGKIDSVVENK